MQRRQDAPLRCCVFLLLVLCAVTGCNRRRAAVPLIIKPEPVPVSAPLPEVAILSSNGYAAVAAELARMLPRDSYKVTRVDVETADSTKTLQSLQRRTGLVLIAIGLPAARVARDRSNGPVIFSQVFNYQELLVNGRAIRGVSAMPPLDLQAKEWKKLDPKLRRIGLIVAQSHSDLIAQAESAARAAQLTLIHETSSSDRETLYVFKRMAPQIDGLWLVPDDRSLSAGVLRELLNYATSHGVRVCVFNDALLPWGAYMSATPTSADTARALRGLLDSMSKGATKGPTLTTASEVLIRLNGDVAAHFGLPSPHRAAWVVRSGR
jgi:ABC-type uncharacterized transport system substrate-binding protein